MSKLDNKIEDSSLRLSNEFKGDEGDFDIFDKVNTVSNAIDLNNCTDSIRSRSGMDSYNRVSPEEKKEDDYRKKMIDLPKLLRQLSLARVVLERLSISTEATKLRSSEDLMTPDNLGKEERKNKANALQNEHIYLSSHVDDEVNSLTDSQNTGENHGLITNPNYQTYSHLIKRYCPKCRIILANVRPFSKKPCTKCGTTLKIQCPRCDGQFTHCQSLTIHLSESCKFKNLDIIHSCSHCEFTTIYKKSLDRHMRNKHKDTLVTNRSKRSDEIKRYCSKCKTVPTDVPLFSNKPCTKCGASMCYQCIRCGKQYDHQKSLIYHLDVQCNPQNLDLKCPKCDYRTHVKLLMNQHQSYCLSEISYNCSHCKFTTKHRSHLHRHMRKKHKDGIDDCYKCFGNPNKCEQCKNLGSICENCHVGFGSNDLLLEHYKLCKQ